MGKATVVSHIGEGRYLVDLDYGKDRIDERIQKIDEQIAQLVTDETAAAAKLAQAQAQLAARQAAVNAAIEAYLAAVEINPDNATQVGPMVAAAEAAIEAGGQVAIAQLELSQIEFAKGEAEKDKTALQAVVVEEQKSVWCADYTTTASGAVATHEVPGEPNHIIIAPAGRAPGAGDGQLLARGAMTSAQAYFNAAILPGWQKFKPTHRIGTISNINEDADTCTVTLEDIKSSAQNLGVNDRTTMSGVPVQYMTCHAKAFTNGERVLVELAGQDWSNPKVIGFADGPKQCPLFVAIPTVIYVTAENGMIATLTHGDKCSELNDVAVNDPATSHALSVEYKLARNRVLIRASRNSEIQSATTAGDIAKLAHTSTGASELQIKRYEITERSNPILLWSLNTFFDICQSFGMGSVTTTPANVNTANQDEMEFGSLDAELVSPEEVRITVTLKKSGVSGLGQYPPTGDWNGETVKASTSKNSEEIERDVVSITLADLLPIEGMAPLEFIKVLNGPYPPGLGDSNPYTWEGSSYIVARYGLPPAP